MHNSLIPNLMVNNVCDTALFYQNILDFSLVVAVADFEDEISEDNIITSLGQGQNLDWANLKLNLDDPASAEFMFQSRRSLEADVPALKGMAINASQSLYLRSYDIDAQFERIRDKVEVVQEPVTRFYGMREWLMKDINGYILCFGEELANG